MNRLLRFLRPLLVLLIFVGAVYLLWHELRDFLSHELRDFPHGPLLEGLRQIRLSQIALAIGLTALNYTILLGYDYLAIRYIGRPLPLRRLLLASFIGHVSSFNFGSIVGGSSMRYRFYSAWGFSTVEVLQLIAILGITFWLGVLFLAGIVFLVAPIPVPEKIAEVIPVADLRALGVVLLAIVFGYVVICAIRRSPMKIWRWELPAPPPPRLTMAQIVVSSADLMVASTVFFTVLPPLEGATYVKVLGVFLLGMVCAVITHIPAGIGIFELVMFAFLAPSGKGQATVAAALVVFRGVYHLLPLMVASTLWLGHEIHAGWHSVRGWFQRRRG